MTLPILDNMQALSTNVEALVATECQRINNSIGTTQGSMASSSTTVGDLQQPSQVELLCPPCCCDTTEAADVKEASVSGRAVLEGVLHGRAVVHKKDTLSTAVDLLKVYICPRTQFCSLLTCISHLTPYTLHIAKICTLVWSIVLIVTQLHA